MLYLLMMTIIQPPAMDFDHLKFCQISWRKGAIFFVNSLFFLFPCEFVWWFVLINERRIASIPLINVSQRFWRLHLKSNCGNLSSSVLSGVVYYACCIKWMKRKLIPCLWHKNWTDFIKKNITSKWSRNIDTRRKIKLERVYILPSCFFRYAWQDQSWTQQ